MHKEREQMRKECRTRPLKMLEVVCLQVWLVLLINCLWTCMNMHQICMANLTPFSLVSVTSLNKPGLHSLHLQVWYYIYIYRIQNIFCRGCRLRCLQLGHCPEDPSETGSVLQNGWVPFLSSFPKKGHRRFHQVFTTEGQQDGHDRQGVNAVNAP